LENVHELKCIHDIINEVLTVLKNLKRPIDLIYLTVQKLKAKTR